MVNTDLSIKALTSQLRALSKNRNVEVTKTRKVLLCEDGFSIEHRQDQKVLCDLANITGIRQTVDSKCSFIPSTNDAAIQLLSVAKRHNYWFKQEAGMKLIGILSLPIEGLNCELFPYQKECVAFALGKNSIFIGDEMGLGKSVQALAIIQSQGNYPALVVTPKSVKSHWQTEIRDKLPGKKVFVVNGGQPKKLESCDFIIINYEFLGKWMSELKKIEFKTVIFDESTFVKNEESIRSNNAMEIAKGIEYKILLSGTPVENRPKDLMQQLKIMGILENFGGKWEYLTKFCNRHAIYIGNKMYWDSNGASNSSLLHHMLLANGFIRREKGEVLPQLPPKYRSSINVPLDNWDEYHAAESGILQYIERLSFSNQEIHTRISKSSNECQSLEFDKKSTGSTNLADNSDVLVRISKLRLLAAMGKISTIVKWAKGFKEPNKKLVIFYYHKSVGEKIASKLNVPLVGGSTNVKKREEILKDFRDNPETTYLVISYKVGGIGIDLSVCNNVAFAELDWSPATMVQAEDRCHRLTTTNNVNVKYFLGAETIDQRIYDVMKKKWEICNQIYNGVDSSQTDMMQETITWLIEKNSR